jgi:hypothetical protein
MANKCLIVQVVSGNLVGDKLVLDTPITTIDKNRIIL